VTTASIRGLRQRELSPELALVDPALADALRGEADESGTARETHGVAKPDAHEEIRGAVRRLGELSDISPARRNGRPRLTRYRSERRTLGLLAVLGVLVIGGALVQTVTSNPAEEPTRPYAYADSWRRSWYATNLKPEGNFGRRELDCIIDEAQERYSQSVFTKILVDASGSGRRSGAFRRWQELSESCRA
jgi:hypothetical protein